jgi:hypothetical protein
MELPYSNQALSSKIDKLERKLWRCCNCDCAAIVNGLISGFASIDASEGTVSVDLSQYTVEQLVSVTGFSDLLLIPIVGGLEVGSTFYFTTSQYGGNQFVVRGDVGVTINGDTGEYFVAVGLAGVAKLVYLGDDAWALEPVCNIIRIFKD